MPDLSGIELHCEMTSFLTQTLHFGLGLTKNVMLFNILKFFFNHSYVYSLYFGTSKIYQSLFRSLDIILFLKKNKCLSKLSCQSAKDDPSLKLFRITLYVYQDGRHIICSISRTRGDCKNLWILCILFQYSFPLFILSKRNELNLRCCLKKYICFV